MGGSFKRVQTSSITVSNKPLTMSSRSDEEIRTFSFGENCVGEGRLVRSVVLLTDFAIWQAYKRARGDGDGGGGCGVDDGVHSDGGSGGEH